MDEQATTANGRPTSSDDGTTLRCADCGAVWGSERARELVARSGECLTCGGVVEGPEVARIRELLDLGEHLATVAELTLHRLEERQAMLRTAVSSWREGVRGRSEPDAPPGR